MPDQLKDPETPTAAPVTVIETDPEGRGAPSLDTLDAPVVFRGLQASWPALERWTLDYFRRDYGEEPVPVRAYEPGEDTAYVVERTTLADFLDYWEHTTPDPELARRRQYLAEWNFVHECPCLLDDFEVPRMFREDDLIEQMPEQLRFGRMWLFFGEPGCATGIHRDTFSSSAWLSMLSGRKELRLVDPAVADHLEAGDSLWATATLDRLAGAGFTPLEVTLGPGDTLYIPSDWYHEVRNTERNLMVTGNFVEQRAALPFLWQFEDRLSEPLAHVRRMRNERAHALYGDGTAPEGQYGSRFVEHQVEWVDRAIAPLLEYRGLLDGARGGEDDA